VHGFLGRVCGVSFIIEQAQAQSLNWCPEEFEYRRECRSNGVVIIVGRFLYALGVIALFVTYTRKLAPEQFERWFGAEEPSRQRATVE
jgi:hypothetical protein